MIYCLDHFAGDAVNISIKTKENIKTWLLSGLLTVLLVSTPQWARAGLVSAFAGHVAERVAEHHVVKQIEGAVAGGQTPIPGLNSPLALPNGDGFQGCRQLFPRNLPVDIRAVNQQWRAVALCNNHFAVLYSRLSKSPILVVEKLNKALLTDALGEERTNEFFPDPRLAKGDRAELKDFAGSGCDRGHLQYPVKNILIGSIAYEVA